MYTTPKSIAVNVVEDEISSVISATNNTSFVELAASTCLPTNLPANENNATASNVLLKLMS